MKQNFIIALSANIKGKIIIEKRKVSSGLIVQRIEKDNLWLDNGTRQCISDTSVPTIYCCLANTLQNPNYSDISIPDVIISVSATRTFEDGGFEYKRHKFLASFSPPANPRVINAVGLAKGSSGTSAYCWTRLSEDVVQNTDETLYVYYFVYVNKPLVEGFGERGWYNFASNLFASSFYFFNSLYRQGRHKWYESRLDDYTQALTTISGSSVLTKYKKWAYGNIGSGGNLGTVLGRWGSIGGSNTTVSGFYFNKRYENDFLGRVWAKLKTATGDFFEVNYLPNGWGRAVEIRPVGGGDVVAPGVTGKLVVEIMSNGNVGQANYRVLYRDFGNTDNLRQLVYLSNWDGTWGVVYKVCNIYGKRLLIVGHYNSNTIGGLNVVDVDTGGNIEVSVGGDYVRGIISQEGQNTIWFGKFSNLSLYPNNVYFTDRLIKRIWTDSNDLRQVQETRYDIPSSIYRSFHDVGNEIWLYDETNIKWVRFDKTTGQVNDTEFVKSNNFPVSVSCRGWYDSNRQIIMDMDTGGMKLYSVGNVDANQFTGVADFSKSTVRDWAHGWQGYNNTGDFYHDTNKLKLKIANSSNLAGTTDTACQLYQVVEDGVFEVTMYVENFVPTVNYQEIALVVKNITGNLSHKRIGLKWNTARRLETVSNVNGGANTTEGNVSFSGTSVRFKITRDTNNIIRCYYSTDPISIPDQNATWTLLGNQTYTLAGRVGVGIFGLTGGANVTQIVATIGDFRFNNGTVYKKIGFIGLSDSVNTVVGAYRSMPDGVVKKFKDYLIALGRTQFVVFDYNTMEVVKRVNYGGSYDSGYIVENGKQCVVSVKANNSVTDGKSFWTNDGVNYNSNYPPIYGTNNRYVDVIDDFDVLFNNGSSFYLGTVIGGFGWDGTKWVCGDENYTSSYKVTHGDWQSLPDGKFEIRFLSNPNNPGATLQSTDKYEVGFGKECIIKDNQQYVTNVGSALYYGNVQKAVETYTNVQSTWTLNAKTNNSAQWLTTDFDWQWKFYFKNSDGSYKYWNNVLTDLNVSEVISNNEFRTNSLDVSWVYNEYKNMYIEFTSGANAGIRKKILEYDGYYKKFVTEVFPNAIQVGDTFKIVVPAMASKVSSITDVNQFVVNETAGTITIHNNDIGSDVEMEYLYVLRSW